MAQNQLAIIVVSRDWFDTAARHLLNNGEPSRSKAHTHIITAKIDDLNDARGLWLKDMTSTWVRNGDPVNMLSFMIPWSFVLALGVVDDQVEKLTPGFRHDKSMDVTESIPEAPAQ